MVEFEISYCKIPSIALLLSLLWLFMFSGYYATLVMHQVMQRHLLTCHPASDAVESRLVPLLCHTLLLWFSL